MWNDLSHTRNDRPSCVATPQGNTSGKKKYLKYIIPKEKVNVRRKEYTRGELKEWCISSGQHRHYQRVSNGESDHNTAP
ncbi:hypothetical protein E2C01_097169 [Portunus trituberculatus]|uniref:Uncharacterized protein n=1 Tax=Portunus trituberculatus TaxID=210409 RepID=A0A5B7JZS2_PORTR|nr:hypothetical protein [Portunus trituberculatus]